MANGVLTQDKPHRSKWGGTINMLPKPTPGLTIDEALRRPHPSPQTNDHSVSFG